jgi:hypothetical protein
MFIVRLQELDTGKYPELGVSNPCPISAKSILILAHAYFPIHEIYDL